MITEGCFYVGAEVTIHGHSFRVTGADDKTLRLMEERSADAFRFSDPVRAAELISGRMDGRAGELRTFLREQDIEVIVCAKKGGAENTESREYKVK